MPALSTAMTISRGRVRPDHFVARIILSIPSLSAVQSPETEVIWVSYPKRAVSAVGGGVEVTITETYGSTSRNNRVVQHTFVFTDCPPVA